MAKTIRLPRITRELVQCQMCGYCIDVCEAHRQTPWESVTPRGKIYYLNQLDKAGFGLIDKVIGRKATISPDFVDAMYKCTGCGNCEEVCHAKIELVKLWEIVRAWLVQEGVAPLPVHKGIAKKIATTGNSFGEPASKRDAWWPADVERADVPDAILYAGCTGSYRMQHIPAAGATILSRAGVKINCMGSEEVCCSSPLLRVGVKDQTMGLAIKTVTKADGIGAKDMVMTCSGCYKTISSNIGDYYSKTGQNVYHFTQYVDKLLKDKKLPLNNEFNAKVTYHDPCHLGRHSKVYEEPRNILKKIKGIDFVEMEKNRDHSRCCGAGGGYKSAFNDFAVNIAAERIKDAEEVGAEVIATACPFCVLNLKAGAKKAGSKVKVMDISEILLHVTGPKVEPAKVEAAPTVDAKELEDARAAVEAAKAELAAAKATAEAAQKEAIAAKEAMAVAKAEAEAAKTLAASADAAKAEIDDLNSKFKEAEAILTEADAAIEQAQKDIDAAKADAANCKAKADKFYTELQELAAEADATVVAKDKEIAAEKERNEVCRTKAEKFYRDAEAILTEADATVIAKDKEIAAEKEKAEKFYTELQELAAEADATVIAKDKEIAAEKEKAEVCKAKAEKFYSEAEALLSEADAAIEAKDKEIAAEKEKAEVCKAKAEKFYSEAEALLSEADAAIEAKDKEIAAEKEKAANFYADVQELAAEADAAIEAKDKEIAAEKEKAEKLYKEAEELLTEADAAILQAEKDIADAKKEAEAAKAACLVAEAAVAEAAREADEFYNEEEDIAIEYDEEEFNWDLEPEGVLRRAAWNKKLRCRRNYGELAIPIAFVKGKVAVYVDVDASAARPQLEADGWIVLSYNGLDITDGEKQAIEIREAVKAQIRSMKKGKKRRK